MTKYIAIKNPQTREELQKYSKKHKLYIHKDTIEWWIDWGSKRFDYLVLELTEKGRQTGGGWCRNINYINEFKIPVLTLNDGEEML